MRRPSGLAQAAEEEYRIESAENAIVDDETVEEHIILPTTSLKRRRESLVENPIAEKSQADTVLYLAYGSNLCDRVFLGRRGIKPLSAINVQVPGLRLTFDLPGIPYREPCFANSARRKIPGLWNEQKSEDHDESRPLLWEEKSPTSTAWQKGMIGTVYELTKVDYAMIVATEGGGASYKDIIVECFPLSSEEDTVVPETPTTQPIRVHTLFAPTEPDPEVPFGGRDPLTRPCPGYSQPSLRYLTLLRDGARERGLPKEYQNFLSTLQPYTITTTRQRIGSVTTYIFWLPIFTIVFTSNRWLQDKKGRSPTWLRYSSETMFRCVWLMYDYIHRPLFGDGERTIGNKYVPPNLI